jgi:hypothetical protein
MMMMMAVVVAMKLVAVKLVRGLGCEVEEEREWKECGRRRIRTGTESVVSVVGKKGGPRAGFAFERFNLF